MKQEKFELILSTESKVIACNIDDFAKKADQYLATLTPKFETDDDFIAGEKEVKELKEYETRIRNAIDKVLNGNKDIAELISTAESIADKFRDERLRRDKLVKTRKAETRAEIIEKAFSDVMNVRNHYESSVSLAIEMTMPRQKIKARLDECAKGKRTIAGLESGVEAEKNLILAELSQEATRISQRLRLIPIAYDYLFNDSIKLIAGDEDLQAIVDERIAKEQQRESEIKAKAEREAIEKAEREAAAKAKSEAEKAQSESQPVAQQVQQEAPPKELNEVSTDEEPLEDFLITLRLSQVTRTKAIIVARQLKAGYDDVKLTRLK